MSIDKYTWFLEVHDFHFVKAQHFALELKLMKCFEYLNSNHYQNRYVSQNLCCSLNFSTLKMSSNHDQPTLVWATSFDSPPNRKNKTKLASFFDTKNKTFNNSRGLRALDKVSVATETGVG